jgi:hypothetical protein
MSRGSTIRLFSAASIIAVVASLMFVPVVNAQDSSFKAYGGARGDVVGASIGGDPTDLGTTTTTSGDGGSGVLPFTGLDVGFLLGGGLLLIAVGAGLARIRPHGPAA